MAKAGIEAAVLNEDTSPKAISQALYCTMGVFLLFASPEYLLHNSRMKKFYANEAARTRILGVLVDEGHVIHEWAKNFRMDYSELKTLRVILRNNIPWWTLSATFTNQIFKTVYETPSFGTSRPFWGIDVGTDRPNLAQYDQPMDPAANSHLSFILFIPGGAQNIPRTIVFLRSISETRDACLAIRTLLPSHFHPLSSHSQLQTKKARRSND
jgi:superfamily II DNA helicase RecQ